MKRVPTAGEVLQIPRVASVACLDYRIQLSQQLVTPSSRNLFNCFYFPSSTCHIGASHLVVITVLFVLPRTVATKISDVAKHQLPSWWRNKSRTESENGRLSDIWKGEGNEGNVLNHETARPETPVTTWKSTVCKIWCSVCGNSRWCAAGLENVFSESAEIAKVAAFRNEGKGEG